MPTRPLRGPLTHVAAAIVLLGAIAAVVLMQDKSLAVLILIGAVIVCRLLVLGPSEPSEATRERPEDG